MGFSDAMLVAGCAPHIDVVHNETITVIGGASNNKRFVCVIEVADDSTLDSLMALGKDRRGQMWMRFTVGNDMPILAPNDKIKRADGTIWRLVDDDQKGFLSNDFMIQEVVAGKDK